MAFLKKISHKSRLSKVVIHSHANTRQPSNVKLPLTPFIRDSRNTWRITNSHKLIHSSTSLTPYESFCKHMNIITTGEDEDARHAELIKRVRSLMTKVTDDNFEDFIMVDALQRLAIDYHFEDEINIILRKRYNQFNKSDLFEHKNLYEVSLCFRILRQNGFYVSADAFMRFKGNCKNFEEKWSNDIIGLMALYEASQFSTEGETILDEAANFSYHLLHDMVEMHNDALSGMVRHVLNSPFQKTLPVFEIKNSAKLYNGTVLQELANLDFNKLQSIHHTKLDQVSRWWNDLGLGQELSRVRDQPVKWYLWPMVALTNPNLSTQRIDLTKIISLIYVIDDIFDVYGTIDELTMFTKAVNRWDINTLEELPFYMRSSFKAIYDTTNEIADKIYVQHGFNPKTFLWNSWVTLCDAFLVEATWFASGHIPMANEYLKNGMVCSGVHVVLVHIFFMLGNATNEEQACLVKDNQAIISAVAKILRLWDDLGSAEDEHQDGHDGSYIQYFLKENEGCSVMIAHEHVENLISDTWKCLNKECLSTDPSSTTFIMAAYNIARLVPSMYSYGEDGSLPLIDDKVKSILYEKL